MSDSEKTPEVETVEVPKFVMDQVRENCGEYGFPTPEGFVKHAIEFLLAEEPDISEEHRQRLLESRRQIERGETYTMGEVLDELDSE